ncbi:hypothetical protein IEO21_02284 [Rhodonia placenta]|uniref:Uncharacterized protein n=1 Tax=Rhodonia placenta TaxID=104341 RepID=A0A8H7P8H7_9APHY|nr:hypothetical protein IEO21_02284 [Postia placenta]
MDPLPSISAAVAYPMAFGKRRSRTRCSDSLYITAQSHFTEPVVEQFKTIMQVLDAESGVIFDKIFQGSGCEIPPSQTGVENLISQGNNVTCQPVLPHPGNLSELHHGKIGTALVPSLMLTIPTPQMPASPVFVPQSPITVFKFAEATSRQFIPLASSSSPLPVPAIPICEDCCLIVPESGQQCASCERQWLACKVWYQANDGGRRQRLKEPYIKPAESNAANRALMEFLGAPTGLGNSYGLGIRAGPEQAMSKSRFRRLAPLLALATADSSLSVLSGRSLAATLESSKALVKKLRLKAFKSSIKQFWAKIAQQARCIPIAFLETLFPASLFGATTSSSSSSSFRRSNFSDDFLGDPRVRAQSSRRLVITSTSRFLEHLVEASSTI